MRDIVSCSFVNNIYEIYAVNKIYITIISDICSFFMSFIMVYVYFVGCAKTQPRIYCIHL